MPFTFGDEPINTGETIGAQCMVNKGDIPINITWYLNGERLINNDNFVTISRLNSRTSSLNIDILNDRHRGNYSCLARNSAGQVEYETPLFINGTNTSLNFAFVSSYPLLPTLSSPTNHVLFLRRWSVKFRRQYSNTVHGLKGGLAHHIQVVLERWTDLQWLWGHSNYKSGCQVEHIADRFA